MKQHHVKQRVVRTFDLGPEQLQIIEEPDQQVRILFRGVWLREDAVPRRERWLPQARRRRPAPGVDC